MWSYYERTINKQEQINNYTKADNKNLQTKLHVPANWPTTQTFGVCRIGKK